MAHLPGLKKPLLNAAPAEEFYHAFQYQNNVFQGYISTLYPVIFGILSIQLNEAMELRVFF